MPREAGGACGRVLLIDTESKFSAPRVAEIARSRWPPGLEEPLDVTMNRLLLQTAGVRAGPSQGHESTL